MLRLTIILCSHKPDTLKLLFVPAKNALLQKKLLGKIDGKFDGYYLAEAFKNKVV